MRTPALVTPIPEMPPHGLRGRTAGAETTEGFASGGLLPQNREPG